jgi:ComF family protein
VRGVLPWVRAVADLVAPRVCAACGLALLVDEEDFCGGCGLLLDRLPHGPAAYVYGGPLADALRRLKYGGHTEHAPALARLLIDAAGPHAGVVDAVVPVPPHASRLRERGFCPVMLLAGPVARALGVPLDRRLVRVRATAPQAGRDAAGRTTNVRGAFHARSRPGRPRVLLVDDVRTTGATLDAAAAALRAAGTREVHLLTLAGVEPLG